MKITAFMVDIVFVNLLLLVCCPTTFLQNEKRRSHGSYMVQSFGRLQNWLFGQMTR